MTADENGTMLPTEMQASDMQPTDMQPTDTQPTKAAPPEELKEQKHAHPDESTAEGVPGDNASAEDADGEEEAGAATGAPQDGAKRKRRRRRRKKAGEAGAEAEAGGADVAAQKGEGAPAQNARKEAHMPLARFFDGRDRGERRHAFAPGEVVAGRVARVDHGASVIDLFGKATAFALANEPREVPLPLPGGEVEEPEETAAQTQGVDLAHVGDAAAGLEGVVGMPGSEAMPSHAADVASAPMPGPGPDGIWGTADDEPGSGEADPARIAQAARALSALGTPNEEGAVEAAQESSVAGEVEAPEEAAAEAAPEEEAPPLEVGHIFRGRVAAVAESGHVAIHNRLVTRAEARLKLAKSREEHRRVWGLVYGFNRGGFDVLVEGVRAFCPVSGITMEHIEDPETLLGRRLEFSVQQAKSGHQGIVVSRRSILEREARKKAKEIRRNLQVGQTVKGRVTQVRDFGLFVDIGGGVEGLVHMSEVSWDRSVRPLDAAKPGDEIEVRVLRVSEPQGRKDRDGRIALSMKALTPDPWEVNLQGVEEGQARKGKVTRTAEFGAFVELAPGVEGLLHVTELGRDLKHASERIKEGEDVFVIVERLDRRARRISLSKMSEQEAKLFEEGGLETSAGKPIRPGSSVKVRVDRVESAGLYVQIEGVIGRRGRGFIPNSEMMTERGTDHRKRFPPGMELDVKVIGADRDGGLRLSRKAHHQDEERRAVQDYRKEAASKGFGTFGDLLKKKLGKR
jgi:small subunit ribosomal protein S1